jgi:hypothetical protein
VYKHLVEYLLEVDEFGNQEQSVWNGFIRLRRGAVMIMNLWISSKGNLLNS